MRQVQEHKCRKDFQRFQHWLSRPFVFSANLPDRHLPDRYLWTGIEIGQSSFS